MAAISQPSATKAPATAGTTLDVQGTGEQCRQAEADQSRREGTQGAGQGRQRLLAGRGCAGRHPGR